MLIVSYDFEHDKIRARFARFLERYGTRIQYSVFQVRDSERVLQNILTEVEYKYRKEFTGADSIIIFHICEGCVKRIRRYGYAKHDDEEVIIITSG